MKTFQDYQKYTSQDQHVWRVLFEQQMKQLPLLASEAYLEGIDKAGFVADHIPNFDTETNPRLRKLTGWSVAVVPGLVAHRSFFELLADKRFPASTWLRDPDHLDYLEEPDMFHDTFGHVPLLTNQAFCDFLARFSQISLRYLQHEPALEVIRRVYWYTVEFGLIRENDRLKIYGGGILSSSGETEYSLFSPVPERVEYDLSHIAQTVVKIDEYQKKYFVIDSYEQLYDSLGELERLLAKLVPNKADTRGVETVESYS